jgi:hypothetical protein
LNELHEADSSMTSYTHTSLDEAETSKQVMTVHKAKFGIYTGHMPVSLIRPLLQFQCNKTRWQVTDCKNTPNVMQIELQIDRVTLHDHCHSLFK